MYKKLLLLILMPHNLLGKQAIIIKPVADMLSSPAKSLCPNKSVAEYLKNIPLSPTNKSDGYSCPRLHQGLFNEVVEVTETTAQEAKVKVLNTFYLTPTQQKASTYWTSKSNLAFLDKIKNKKLIPSPINYDNPQSLHDKNTITLIAPWRSTQTKQTFSVGTRFTLNLSPSKPTPKSYTIYIYNPKAGSFVSEKIKKQYCTRIENKTIAQRRNMFVELVKKWATPNHGRYIPYVWGGVSYINRLATKRFKTINKKMCGKMVSYYQVPRNNNPTQYGFDCSGIIMRSAQAVGIPYFYKNTTTLAANLEPLAKNDSVQNGDLLWMRGHIVIIVDAQKGICVEARDYSHNYGQVQIININKLFKETKSISDLVQAHHKQTTLNRLDKDGEVRGQYRIKIFKLV